MLFKTESLHGMQKQAQINYSTWKNSVEVGIFVTSFIYLVLFIQIQNNSWPAFLLL